MRILLAPDSFKGTLSAAEFCRAASQAFGQIVPGEQIDSCPLADGGEGSLEALHAGGLGCWQESTVVDAMNRSVEVRWLRIDDTAVVELAQAAGLAQLAPEERDPLATSTRGVGDQIRAAIDAGCRRVVLTLGGSATVDGGTGALTALGFRFLDVAGRELVPGGGALTQLARIEPPDDLDALRRVEWTLARDVDAPLLGAAGAAPVFAPQKGASPTDVARLDAGLRRLSEVIGDEALAASPGTGAAGGADFGFRALLDARSVSGFEWIAERLDVDRRLAAADWVVTGEGTLDSTSRTGKVVGRVAERAQASDRRCLVVVGRNALGASIGDALIVLEDQAQTADAARRDTVSVLRRSLVTWAKGQGWAGSA